MAEGNGTTSSIYENGEYLRHHPSWHAEDSDWKARHIYEILVDHDINPATVCEVGCGSGIVLQRLSEALVTAERFVGYDVAADAITMARSNQNERIQFVHADLLAIESPQFDLVLAIDVFEHVEDYLGFLRLLRKKGKYFVFHIPLDLSLWTIVRPNLLLNMREIAGHLHYFNRETALATLESTGYQIVARRYTSGGIDLVKAGWCQPKSLILRELRRALAALNPGLAARVLTGFSLLILAQ